MLGKLVRVGVVAAVAAGGTLAFTTPAEAAKPKCALGTWKLVKQELKASGTVQSGENKGKKFNYKVTGSKGLKLKISATKTTYDFSKAAKELYTGDIGGTVYKHSTQYRKTLTMKSKLTGSSARGVHWLYQKTASGSATSHMVTTAPKYDDNGTFKLAPYLRKGGYESNFPSKAYFDCTSKYLAFSTKWTGDDSYKAIHNILLRRA